MTLYIRTRSLKKPVNLSINCSYSLIEMFLFIRRCRGKLAASWAPSSKCSTPAVHYSYNKLPGKGCKCTQPRVLVYKFTYSTVEYKHEWVHRERSGLRWSRGRRAGRRRRTCTCPSRPVRSPRTGSRSSPASRLRTRQLPLRCNLLELCFPNALCEWRAASELSFWSAQSRRPYWMLHSSELLKLKQRPLARDDEMDGENKAFECALRMGCEARGSEHWVGRDEEWLQMGRAPTLKAPSCCLHLTLEITGSWTFCSVAARRLGSCTHWARAYSYAVRWRRAYALSPRPCALYGRSRPLSTGNMNTEAGAWDLAPETLYYRLYSTRTYEYHCIVSAEPGAMIVDRVTGKCAASSRPTRDHTQSVAGFIPSRTLSSGPISESCMALVLSILVDNDQSTCAHRKCRIRTLAISLTFTSHDIRGQRQPIWSWLLELYL